jgi:hypothetical protein
MMLSERLRKVFDDPQRKTWWVFQCDSPTANIDTPNNGLEDVGGSRWVWVGQEIWSEEFPVDEVIWMLK